MPSTGLTPMMVSTFSPPSSSCVGQSHRPPQGKPGSLSLCRSLFHTHNRPAWVATGEYFSFEETYDKSYAEILANSVLWLCAAGDVYDGGKVYQVIRARHEYTAQSQSVGRRD
jgi:hypothetical protein